MSPTKPPVGHSGGSRSRLGECPACGPHTYGSGGAPNGMDCACGQHFHFGDDLWVRTDRCIVCPTCKRALSPLDLDLHGVERERERDSTTGRSERRLRIVIDPHVTEPYYAVAEEDLPFKVVGSFATGGVVRRGVVMSAWCMFCKRAIEGAPYVRGEHVLCPRCASKAGLKEADDA